MQIYDIKEQLKKLHKQNENIKIKQNVFDKLINTLSKSCNDNDSKKLL